MRSLRCQKLKTAVTQFHCVNPGQNRNANCARFYRSNSRTCEPLPAPVEVCVTVCVYGNVKSAKQYIRQVSGSYRQRGCVPLIQPNSGQTAS